VLRTLGQGRAARAQLVESTMADGRVITCVEKVFAPGLLTRLIYRLSFQSPFAYQSNSDAIKACYYRRRVAAAIFASSDDDVDIAMPIYVRYDTSHRAWVLAARWVDGRGIKPAAADAARIRRWFKSTADKREVALPDAEPEIDQLVALMHNVEATLGRSGLVGSGWQVAPRAMVSTANLLRSDDRYTVIDLESGIPAVLVPHYVFSGLCRGALPPFDDLDADMLRQWLLQNDRRLTLRLGADGKDRLRDDVEALITHTERWKNSELAIFRRPWRHLTRRGAAQYQAECIRRWRQEGVVDPSTAMSLPSRPLKARMIWWAGVLPWKSGRFCAKVVGNREFRGEVGQWLWNREVRDAKWRQAIEQQGQRWIESGRLPPGKQLTKLSWLMHGGLRVVTPAALHRRIVDPLALRNVLTAMMLVLFCPRYQSWLGGQQTEKAIDQWQASHRITADQADRLRNDLCGSEVLAYARGFAGHLALKTLAPVIVPAKVGGLAAFAASGNAWFLLPLLSTPALRTLITLASAWGTRKQHIPHGEALVTGWLPIIGSVAFPLQMFSTRPRLSTFLIRDVASKLGRRMPVYGGADSRTELAMIRLTDFLIEVMDMTATGLRKRVRVGHRTSDRRTESTMAAPLGKYGIVPGTAWGRWLDRKAIEHIERHEKLPIAESPQPRIAA
jgi:hypothetical protein